MASKKKTSRAQRIPPIDTGGERLLVECYRGYKAGVLHAFVDALKTCADYGTPIPAWVIEAATELCEQQKRPTGMGRTGNLVAKSRADDRHYARWEAVKEVRSRNTPPTWDDTYVEAQRLLEGTDAYAAPDTIKASYHRMQKKVSKQPPHNRFYLSHYAEIGLRKR